MRKTRTNRFRILSLALSLVFASTLSTAAQKKPKEKKEPAATGVPVLWREPTDIEHRNVLLGAGGERMKPDLSRVTFVAVQTGGHSTKYRVKDGAGRDWIAKVGQEAQSEAAANRLVWVVGYESEITYLVPHLTIEGKGSFDNVRLEARPKDVKRSGQWSWAENPFKGTPQLQGLKIMMLLVNNWDMKDENNEILLPRDAPSEAEARYIVSDLGGTLGKTGGFISRSRNKPSDFVKADFIAGVKGDRIQFRYGGKNKQIFEDITVADARWLSRWLKRLSDEQIKDAFRAANYNAEEVEALARAVRERIDELAKISGNEG